MRKVLYTVGMDAKLHRKKLYRDLKRVKRDVKTLQICVHCEDCETEQEEEA